VSELRYNLPSADLFKLPEPAKEAMKQSAAATIKSLKRTSQVVKTWQNKIRKDSNEDATRPSLPPRPSEEAKPTLPVRPPSTSYTAVYVSGDEDDFAEEDAELDLSLGREKAGGGNRGKRAKLGKLIIFDEGFKMLDLIVGANFGVWWGGWGV
nr:hypothetical protein [Leuconostoc sp.]